MIRIPETSLEYLKVPVTSDDTDDPTTGTAEIALLDKDEHSRTADPEESDWVTANWYTKDGENFIRALVGPGSSLEVGRGDYWVWVRVTHNPERVVRNAGRIMVV